MTKSKIFFYFCLSLISGIFLSSVITVSQILILGFLILGIILISILWRYKKIVVVDGKVWRLNKKEKLKFLDY